MASPTLELQGAIYDRLLADPGVQAIAVDRVFDQPPPLPERVFPYVSFGPFDIIEDDPECFPTANIFVQIDVWSRAVGFPECHRLSGAVFSSLHDAPLVLPANALVVIQHQSTRLVRDPDGLTSHAAMTFEALVERR